VTARLSEVPATASLTRAQREALGVALDDLVRVDLSDVEGISRAGSGPLSLLPCPIVGADGLQVVARVVRADRPLVETMRREGLCFVRLLSDLSVQTFGTPIERVARVEDLDVEAREVARRAEVSAAIRLAGFGSTRGEA